MLGTRQRKAALTGSVLPHELLARLAQLEETEPDLAPAPAGEVQRETAEEPHHKRLSAEPSAAGSKEAGDGAGGRSPARLTPQASGDRKTLYPDSASMAGTSAASAARRAGGQASSQRTSVPGAKTSGTQQTPAEPLPAYTSLARQQLQQRLKAAIAAGTRSASTAAAAHVAQPSEQPSRAGRKAAGRHPQQMRAPGLAHSPRLPLGPTCSCASAAVLAQQQALAGLGVPDTLPVPSPASLEDGFQLLLPGSAGRIGIAGSDQKPQPASPVQSGVDPRQQHLPLTPASSAQPHWLGGHLLRQRLYMAAPECPGQQQHAQRGVQRGLLALRMPPLTSQFAGGRFFCLFVWFFCWNIDVLACRMRSDWAPSLAAAS